MTVKKLYNLRVDKPTFYSPLEGDGAVVLDVYRVDLQSIPNIDDDGGTKVCKNGSESLTTTVVIGGCLSRCPRCGAVDCEQDHNDNSPVKETP